MRASYSHVLLILVVAPLVLDCQSKSAEGGVSTAPADVTGDGARSDLDDGFMADILVADSASTEPSDGVVTDAAPVVDIADSGADVTQAVGDGGSGADSVSDGSDSEPQQALDAAGDSEAKPDSGDVPNGDSTDKDTTTPVEPPCIGDQSCPQGQYCTASGCHPGGIPCSDETDCVDDPLGPECHDGVCGGCTWFPPLWEWKGDVEKEIPDDLCPDGRYCPPGYSEACDAPCTESPQCTAPGRDFCGPTGRCGCSDDPALNSCEKFCMMEPWGTPAQPWGKCVGCQPFVVDSGIPQFFNPGIKLCTNDGGCYGGMCMGGMCGFETCADDTWCNSVKFPALGVEQVEPQVRCSSKYQCVAACSTVEDCPAVMRSCIPDLACLPDESSGFSFCQVAASP